MTRIIVVGLMLALAGCATDRTPAPTVAVGPPPPAWRNAIVADDVDRIERLPGAWATARQRLGRRAVAAVNTEGDLLRADAALAHPALPPGSYKCRLVTMGRMAVRKAGSFFCYIGDEVGERISFTKQTGPTLLGGWLYPDGDRYVFMGTRQQRPGDASLGYGTDRARDRVGVVERIGPFRWRLAMPGEAFEVYELTPVPVEQQGATSKG